ncbi:MAG: NAD-dependent epimerase/dehydratase family protein [Flavobacteriales bacterium]|nr:NAD-dependent epimerase/dehydratase family protein [Flavobacteriales bacterium]
MASGKILVIGAAGQIGVDLVLTLRKEFGDTNVVASDIRVPAIPEIVDGGPFENLNILNDQDLLRVVEKHNIDTVYHLAAMLSATAEKNPDKAWDLNMTSLFYVLDLARAGKIKKIFWPSSIAVFGPTTPPIDTPQHTICEPTTVYGISKLAGEQWCSYYHQKFGVDVRSIRYPGLISYKSAPGGGTTDYAVEIFHEAIRHGHYTSFLKEDTALPMMYMDDAIRATIEITNAPADRVPIRTSYNLSGMSFTPAGIAAEIKKHIPGFTIDYNPDFRQNIADSWPSSINDDYARRDWGWQRQYDLSAMTEVMIREIRAQIAASEVTF